MDQNQSVESVDNDDLQKAIDNITNNTNDDPVFSDPVATPSSVPEGDTGELGEPVGPFPAPKVDVVTQGPEPMAPLESMDIPELSQINLATPPVPPEPAMPEEAPAAPAAPATPPAPTVETPDLEPIPQGLNTGQIKKAALRDLVPLLDKVNMNASQKFKIYQDIFDDLKDYTILEPAYNAAREIPDESERAQALLYLVESIDKM